MAETEEAVDGDRWFWADDNAKVLEFLALPALWYGGLSIMLATLPLLGARSWTGLRRVAARGRSELAIEIAAARRLGRRHTIERPLPRTD